MATIDDLPAEILVKIFKYLPFKEVQKNCLNTSKRWQEIVAEHILSSEIKIHMALDPGFKTCLLRNGWTPENNDAKAILNAWNEYLPYRTKFLECNCCLEPKGVNPSRFERMFLSWASESTV